MEQLHRDILTCNEAIDNQHESIFKLLQELNHSMTHEGGAETGRILSTLAVFVVAHFRMEEALMKEARYPGIAPHREHHAYLAARVEVLVDRFRLGFLSPSDLATFMSDWIVRHITEFDAPMANFLAHRNHPGKSAPVGKSSSTGRAPAAGGPGVPVDLGCHGFCTHRPQA